MSAAGRLSPSLPQASALERWQRLRLRWRVVLGIVLAALAVELVWSAVGGIYNPSPAPLTGTGSTLDATPPGAAALAQLLRQNRHPVTALTVPLLQASGSLPPGGAVFVLDPTGEAGPDAVAMRRLLLEGDDVVLAGHPSAATLATLFGRLPPPTWSAQPSGTAHPTVATAALPLPGVGSVTGGDEGTWSAAGAARPLLVGPGGAMALIARLGPGRLVLLASTTPLSNQFLDRADDAAFALDLAGGPGSVRPVAFDEYDHDVGHEQAGLVGLPGHWKAGLLIGLVAVALALVGAARRHGPPMPADRELIPPRVEHLDAMATLLSASSADHLAEGAEPVRLAVLEELRRRLRLPESATPDQVREALTAAAPGVAGGAALPEGVAATVLAPASAHPDDVVRLGRALALLTRGGALEPLAREGPPR